MNIDFAPSPSLSSPGDDENSPNGICFEWPAFSCKTNDLFEAAANGQVEDIQTYLSTTKNKADILDQHGASALHHAARMNRVQVIDFMLKAGASVDVYSRGGLTPLHVAARSNALEALDNLLKKGAKPNVASSSKSRTPLHVAAQFGHKQIIERLLNVKNLDIDATDQQGMTALHLAISRGYEDICTDLIDNGASINMTTKEGLSCLHLAADAGNTEIVSLVIQTALRTVLKCLVTAMQSTKNVPEFNRFINQRDADQNSALHLGVQTGQVSMCKVLLQHGADINIQNKHLQTPLHVASIGKNKDILELLIKQGAQTNTKDFKQSTPLHSAASFGNLECVKVLLKNFASIDSKEVDAMTPFLCAVAAGHTNCAKLLLESGADITARDKYQRCCIHLAVENDKEDVLKMLLERYGSGLTNVPDIRERTALHYAALSTNTRLLDILLEKKANCLLRDGAGKTPLHIAAETGKARHVESLAKGSLACVCQKDPDDRTPLHFAALNGKEELCSVLIQMGAEVDSSDVYGWTPLLFAAKTGATGLIQMFLECNANIDHQDQTGNTALLIASARGHVDAVRILLDRQASLKPDENGLNCLDVAIENQKGDVVMAIIKNARWREVLSAKSPDGHNRMGKLIQLFPDAAKSVMDRCIQRSLPQRSIKYDFSLLDPGPDDQSGPNEEPFFGLVVMVKHKQKDLLVHGLCRKLLKIKWRSYGWFVYWTNLVIYALYLFLMTYFMLTKRKQTVLKRKHDNDDDDKTMFEHKNTFNKIIPYLILVFASFHLVKELYQIVVQRVAYFKQLTNLLEWVLYVSSIIFILPYVSNSFASLQGDPRVTWQIGTVAVFLGYMNLILFVQTLDSVGIYVTMFFQVAITVLKTISLFLLFAIAFSVVFYILFREQDAFDSFWMTLAKVIVMTVGEESSFIFLCIFIFAMPIVLMNLLVGLAVGDIESVQKYAFLRNKGKFIDFVVGVERNFPKFITRRFHKPQLVVTGRYVEKKISSQKYYFEDVDLDNEEQRAGYEDEQRLEVLTKELLKAKKRQMLIIDKIRDQRNILLAVAAKAGVDTREEDDTSRDVSY
ncbi:hypothetical protein OS493_013808 [Desmophyllum pertusum]|uniref:Ion transport domain-containing protein n=1 Tax=Desmophyllum pertusum TaxID=174260 RepID=A0A9W9ZRG0_9CNID|nr:hypothetical protein OS493_013808 [Desmophyllum pertusum]